VLSEAMTKALVQFAGTTLPQASIQKADEGVPTMHGPGGLLSDTGVYPDMYTTVLRPRTIADLLWNGLSNVTNPRFETLTALSGPTGSAPAEVCAEAPRVGSGAVCRQDYEFGALKYRTEIRDITKVGARQTFDERDRRLLNIPQGTDNPFRLQMNDRDINSETAWNINRLWMQTERTLSKLVFQGDSTVAAGASTFDAIEEFDGFDVLISTGKVDAKTSTPSPAADSFVENYAYEAINGGANDIVEWVTGIVYELQDRAERLGLWPLEMALAMPADLFRALTLVWPCSYLTTGCGYDGTDGKRVTTDAYIQTRMRDEMRRGSFLWVNEQRIPVLLADGMDIVDGNGTTTGDTGSKNATIYALPLSAGGMKLTYLEGFNLANADLTAFRNMLGTGNSAGLGIANGGMYLLSQDRTSYCINYEMLIKPRLVMRSTWLAGRIDNVNYTLRNYVRSPYPGDAEYAGGGRTA
ncbi:hypothetical protein ACFLYO_09755, partial [Chloroflexota bacterium]